MSKLSLKANPTFNAKVGIPIPGSDPVEVEFTFKHRTKAALDEFVKSRTGKTDAESFMDMVSAWELGDEFNAKNVEELLQNYSGAAIAALEVYIDELVKHKAKN